MKTTTFFEQKTRDNGTKFYCIIGNKYEDSLQTLIRELHSDIFPIDEIYEIVKDCIDALIECDSLDASYEVSDSFFPIYTHEINTIFSKISPVIVMLWDELQELINCHDLLDPNEYMQACVYAYENYCLNRCRDFLESIEYWKE